MFSHYRINIFYRKHIRSKREIYRRDIFKQDIFFISEASEINITYVLMNKIVYNLRSCTERYKHTKSAPCQHENNAAI